ncbi:DNA-directed RNA polymerase [Aspergillus undulatus]|uniref:DNA-directed RNA polymerase n=1 Tax=Aspergillus undulatus TaxID=1810928 RepID=UPI003CCDF53E
MLSQLVRSRNAASQLRLLKGRSLLQSSAKLHHHSHTSRITSLQTSTDNATSDARRRRPSFQSSRALATATDPPIGQTYFDNQSFVADLQQEYPWNSLFPAAPGEFNPSSLVIVDEAMHTQTKAKTFRKIRGVGGDEEEMLANLELSLKVCQFDRASNLINRLREFHPVGSQTFIDLNNQLLQAMVSHAIRTRSYPLVNQMQRWFEVDMPYGGIEADGTTYAVMIQMALRMFHYSKRDRAVRRYWELAKEAHVEEDVLAVPVLSERELGQLSEICSADLQRVAIDSMEPRIEKEDTGPEVLAVEQKGLGLSSLKESMSIFSKAPLPLKADPEDVESKEMYEQRRQQQLEADVMRVSLNRWQMEREEMQKVKPEAVLSGDRLGYILSQWHTDLTARIHEELDHVAEAQANPIITAEQRERCAYGVYLHVMEPERLANLTIMSAMGILVRHGIQKGIKLAPLVVQIGNELYDDMLAEKFLQNQKQTESKPKRLKAIKAMLGGRKERESRIKWKNIIKNMEKEDPKTVWSTPAKAKVGAVLMSLLFEVAKVPVAIEEGAAKKGKKKKMAMQPAFQHSYQIAWGRRNGFIHVHPEMVKIVTKEPPQDLLGRHLPMICKPKPWTAYSDGAYFLHQNYLVRTTPGESLQPEYVRSALENHGLEKLREGLDILGGTGWTINQDVFNVMLEAWNSGEAIADLAPLNADLPIPPKPSPEEGYEAQRKWDLLVRDIENKRGGYHSQRCFQNFQLEVARAYLNETFYLPHNMDFRGRAYPIPPYLNQMGADNARGMLLFSEAKPLGESGLRWLKIQIANLAGFDKASLSEREQWTMDKLDDVLDSANNGLKGRRWWLKAEDPWQCLAACCELRNALQLSNPAEYASRLPIHQDGSCNGLQHYAALGGDKAGAEQVNLEPSDRPSDVYSGVAEFVKEAVKRDAAQGVPIAKTLDGKVTRKVVKQTVMTNVYGVTFMGAMQQVRKQLVDHYPEFTNEQKHEGALYIARKIFEALGTMFTGAHDIQYWLGDCASRITQSITPAQIDAIAKDSLTPTRRGTSDSKANDPAKHFKQTVIWTTPLGLPVVQPYRTRIARRIDTALQGLNIVDRDSGGTVSKRKQLQAFPPNFIHSLDATHMMLSASACHKAGLTFSAVHDSFWTHASDVDSMNRILREAFVKMHSDDVIKRLAAEFKVRYGRNLFYAKIPKSSKVAKAIHAWRKGNKRLTRLQELVEENKRQTLLNSDDPELQAQGRAMVTPASVFEELGGTDKDLNINNSLGATAVGHVPEELGTKPPHPSLEADTSDPAIAALFGNEFTSAADLQATEAAELEALEAEGQAEAEAELEGGTRPAPEKKAKKKQEMLWLWLPLRFPEVPKKGEWDVTRIRQSEYFFS